MVRKNLFVALGLGLCAQGAFAQEDTWYDDRWMLTPSVGINLTDGKRKADNGYVLGIGFGRFISPRFHLEFDVNYSDPDLEVGNGSFTAIDAGINGRLFFANLDGRVRPYALAGLRSIHHDRDGSKDGRDAGAHLGLGVVAPFNDDLSFRGEVVYRYDTDDESILTQDDYSDVLITAGLSFALGEASRPEVTPEAQELGEPEPQPEPEPEPACVDADGDGVCDDRDNCLNSTPGAMVDRNGCEVSEVIDLRGVNFDFDKCNLRPDAVEILNNAVGVLKSNELRVSVEGHTDAVGTDAYNQKLSECRAKVVYDYLLENGVEGGKLTGSKGFGESQPIDTNETAEGRARNRRTELKKQ